MAAVTIDPSYDPAKDPAVHYEVVERQMCGEIEYASIVSTTTDVELFIPSIFLVTKPPYDWETP